MTAMFVCGHFMLFDTMTGFDILQLNIELANVSTSDNSTARQALGQDGPNEAAEQQVPRLSKVILRNPWLS